MNLTSNQEALLNTAMTGDHGDPSTIRRFADLVEAIRLDRIPEDVFAKGRRLFQQKEQSQAEYDEWCKALPREHIQRFRYAVNWQSGNKPDYQSPLAAARARALAL